MEYRIAIAPGTDENPDFGVIVPDLPGCYSQGDDLEDAVGKAKWDEGGKNGLANPGGLRHDTTSFKESFHGHAPPPVHS